MTTTSNPTYDGAQPAPEQQPEAQRLAHFLLNMQTRLGSCREACGDEHTMKAWDDYSRAATLLAASPAQAEHAATLWVEDNGHIDFETSPFFVKPPGEYPLYSAPPAPTAVAVPESHTQALKAIAEWPVTDMLLNMDAANMRGIAQRALAAATAQAVPEQWIDDPHDIEQGRMLNPEWVRAQKHATQLAGQGLAIMGKSHISPAAPAQPQEDACPVLDDEWKRRMLDGRALVRDDMGCGYHPALPTLDEGMNPKQFFEALGIQLAGSMADGEMDMDAYDAMVEATDYNVWTPGAPDGEGWALVAIFDTEDGPAAWWIREAAPKQPARRGRKSAHDAALPSWWPDFIQSVAELPDRNSPEDEPDAMVATADELSTCAINAIDAARAAQGGA